MIKMKRMKKGFTLIEVLVSMSITMALVGTSTSFLYSFSKISNRNIIKNTMLEEIRVTVERLEKEMLPANKVIFSKTISGTSYTTGKDTVVLEAPVMSSQGFYITDSTGIPEKDTMVISTTNDGDSLKMRTTSGVKLNKLRFTLERSPHSNRITDLKDQVLYSQLMPVNGGNYDYPGIISGGDAVGVFTYYDKNGNDITSTIASQANCTQIATIRVTLWAEREYSGYTLAEKKTMDITIRNFEGI